jgi:hypothetical protein
MPSLARSFSKAGLDRDIWQCPVVLLADVHSVGVQGDERTYGSPIVLRPVSSEDAMTADWSRVPYDVLSAISTRITNECRGINRVALDVHIQAAGNNRVGVSGALPSDRQMGVAWATTAKSRRTTYCDGRSRSHTT